MIGAETTISPATKYQLQTSIRTSCNEQQDPSCEDKEVGEDISEFAHYAQGGIR